MAIIDGATQAEAEVLANAGCRLPQVLQEIQDGAAGPNRRGKNLGAVIDQRVLDFIEAARTVGYIPEGGELPDGDFAILRFDGEPFGRGVLEMYEGEVIVRITAET